jgi:spermidine synthase/MFS family permease
MGWYFAFFFVSGLCSVLYELVWLRLAMAQFGVTTALVSIVLSAFMAGLGIGSWAAGGLMRRYAARLPFPPLRLYALCELLIGCSALAVPWQLVQGRHLLESITHHTAMSSLAYYLASGTVIALIVIPWCVCMGATIPLAMAAIGRDPRLDSRRSFSFLYLANVVGAVLGAIVPLFLVELEGFHSTLRVGAVFNFLLAICAYALSLGGRSEPLQPARAPAPIQPILARVAGDQGTRMLLFLTGLTTLGMEIVWARLFTPYLGSIVYAFAAILVSYLIATFAGSSLYRALSRTRAPDSRTLWILLALLGLLPLLTADPRLPLHHLARVLRAPLGIMPFAAVVGFLTPMLVDRWSGGDPDRAGSAYAVNVVGCILGPLLAGFFLLPLLGEHGAMLVLVLPWMAMALPWPGERPVRLVTRTVGSMVVGLALLVFLLTRDYETIFPRRRVLRDSTATVIATGTGMGRQLLTNGVGMTTLTPITKMMAHLTLASHDQPPRSALVICFGMGTTYRSVLSWGIPATVAELVPSVPRLFTYFHSDGHKLLASPLSHVVIDDGRRFLERVSTKYDVIIIDPPPPVQAAGSSLLYSKEFYALAGGHLNPGGILQQWLPYGDPADKAAVARALADSFTYVAVYPSVDGTGWHFLASMSPIPSRTAEELVARMPSGALADMMEWGPARTPTEQLERMLAGQTSAASLISLSPRTPALQDDRPINEYFLLRALSDGHLRSSLQP